MTVNADNFIFNPTQQRLFGRAYTFSIGAAGQSAALQYTNFPQSGQNNEVKRPSNLRIKFDIEKNLLGVPNNAKFELYNLSTVNRQAIRKGYIVMLEAGYNGLTQTLFTGNVASKGMKVERRQSDIIMSFEAGDGEAAIVMAKLDKSYPPGTTLAQVLQDIADAMKVESNENPSGVDTGIIIGIPNYTFGRGLTVNGPCRVTLDKLLKPRGMRWSVQNGLLNIIPATGHDGNTAILVSTNTGMIGVPSNNGEFTKFTSLLNPLLVPGALVKLESQNTALNGFYKIEKAHYEGDTHDAKWQVECECRPMPNVRQKLPAAVNGQIITAVA